MIKDYNYWLEEVKKTGYSLNSVPKEIIDYSICFESVKNNGYSLKYVPKELMDYNLCLEAVKKSSQALQFISKEFLTIEICENALKYDSKFIFYLFENKNFLLVKYFKDKGNLRCYDDNKEWYDFEERKYKYFKKLC